MGERRLLGVVVALLFVMLLLPLLTMLAGSLWSGSTFSLAPYRALLGDGALLQGVENSLLLALAVASSTTFTGMLLGILLGRSSLPFANGFALLWTLPLLIPPYILALAWSSVMGTWFFGFYGVWFVLFWIYLPLPLLLTMGYLRLLDPSLEEAGLLVGAWPVVLRSITLPLLSPVLLFSFVLLFLLAFGEYSVANFLRYPVFATQSFVYFSAFYDFKAATAAAMPLLPMMLLVVWLERLLREKMRFDFTQKGVPQKIVLGRWQLPLLILMTAATLLPLLPVGMLLWQSGGGEKILEVWESAKSPLIRSLIDAFWGATLLTLFGFLGGYIIEKRRFGWWRWFEGSVLLLFAIPSALYGISLILFWNTPYTNLIYATPLILLTGYLGKYLALTTKIAEAKLSQIPESLTEAAALCGAVWHARLRYILLPLSKEALLLAWVVGFLFCLREDTLAMLLHPPGSATLPVYILTQMANGDPSYIAALSLLMVLLTLVPVALYLLYRMVPAQRGAL